MLGTLKEISEQIIYKEDDFKITAVFCDKIIGVRHKPTTPEVVTVWKENILEMLARESCTIELQTRCGCSRIMDLSQPSYSVMIPLELKPDFDFNNTTRQFDFEGRYNVDGLKIYEEEYF